MEDVFEAFGGAERGVRYAIVLYAGEMTFNAEALLEVSLPGLATDV